jgi:pyruvate dehydrogenase E2 component (dihydrolipoamide acetyltransferase)
MVDHFGVDPTAIAAAGPRVTKGDVERHIAGLLEDRPAALPSQAGSRAANGAMRAVPAARRLARELGIDLATVTGSGPDGRIQSKDVEAAQAHSPISRSPNRPSPDPSTPAIRRTVPLTGMRRTIAARLTASVQEIPQFTASVTVNMARANQIIADIRADADAHGPKVTVTTLLVKACAWALARHPGVNASWREQDGRAEIVEWDEINVGVAVALEAGLVVPVIRGADGHSLTKIAGMLADLSQRARSNSLKPDDMAGGTFTISNLGMVGVERFTAIINPPQAAILAVGRTVSRPAVDAHGQVVVQPLAELTLTSDHRLIDGALAGRFLTDLKGALEFPGRLFL